MTAHTSASLAFQAPITEVIAPAGDGSVVVTDAGRVDLPVVVNRPSALRFLRTVRRVDRVEIDVEAMVAVASGRSHRRPFRRRIPVSMALGLAQRGIAATLVGGAR